MLEKKLPPSIVSADACSAQSLAVDVSGSPAASPESPVVLPGYIRNEISIVGLGGYGVRCVSRLTEKMPPTVGDATVEFISIDGTNRMRHRLLETSDIVILVGGIGRDAGLELPVAEQERRKFGSGDASSFVMAVVALPFASDQPDLDVKFELERIKRCADMVCIVSHDEWAAYLGKQIASKAEVMAHCEREVDRCIEAFIEGVGATGFIGIDINDIFYMFGDVGRVAYGQGRVKVDGADWQNAVPAAIRQGGMERAIVGAERVLLCYTAPALAGKLCVPGGILRAVMNELKRHISADAMIVEGMQCDMAIPLGTLQFDLWVGKADIALVSRGM